MGYGLRVTEQITVTGHMIVARERLPRVTTPTAAFYDSMRKIDVFVF